MSPIAIALVLAAAAIHAGWNLLLHRVDDRLATMAVAGLVGGAVLLPAALAARPCRRSACRRRSRRPARRLSAAYRRGALAVAYPIGARRRCWYDRGWERREASAGRRRCSAGGWPPRPGRPTDGAVGAVGLRLLTGVTMGGDSLIDTFAVRQVAPAGYLGPVLLLHGLMVAGLLRADYRRLRRALAPGLLVAAGSTGGYLLVLFAFQQAAAG
jgi:hypothetical protein